MICEDTFTDEIQNELGETVQVEVRNWHMLRKPTTDNSNAKKDERVPK